MSDTLTALATGFAPVTQPQWTAAIEKALKGKTVADLIRTTDDGIAIQPLYTHGPDTAQPLKVTGTPTQPWAIAVDITAPHPATANTHALEALSGGATTLILHLDPTGTHGIAALSADDLRAILDGVYLNIAPISFDAGLYAHMAMDSWTTFAPADARPVAINADPIGVLARTGTLPGPLSAHLIRLATRGAALVKTHPASTVFRASGSVAFNASGTHVQELGLMLASALCYAKALMRAGLDPAAAFAAITADVAVDQRYFEGIAKVRAARRLWANLTAAYGVEVPVALTARGAPRMLSASDPHSNILRLTAAAFAGAVGGVDTLALPPYTANLGIPDAQARRISRNIQLVAMMESHLGAVADPAGGSWFLETLTEDLATAAWTQFQAIEAAGGVEAALTTGRIQSAIAQARTALTTAINSKKRTIIGVTDFPLSAPPTIVFDTQPPHSIPAPDARLPGPDATVSALPDVHLDALFATPAPEMAQ
jgi:methylmalonyl-CoA mutase